MWKRQKQRSLLFLIFRKNWQRWKISLQSVLEISFGKDYDESKKGKEADESGT